MSSHRHNRREFLGLTGVGVAGLAGSGLMGATASGETRSLDPRSADLVVFNAKVYTVDPRTPQAEAFCFTKSSSAILTKWSLSPLPALSINSAPKRSTRRRAFGLTDTSST